MHSTVLAIATTFSGLFAISGAFFYFLGIPAITKKNVAAFRRLEDGAGGFSSWKELPVPLHFKVFFFNVTNPDEVMQGKNPVLNEIGPYIYDYFKSKVDYTFDGDTITYMSQDRFYFNEKLSGCRQEDDVVTILNVALMGTAAVVKKSFPMGISYFNQALQYLFSSKNALFKPSTVREILFDGVLIYCNSTATAVSIVCKSMVNYLPPQIRKLENSTNFAFSFFYNKNETAAGPFREVRGINNISNVGSVIEFKNHPYFEVWQENSTCDWVRGYDLSALPPFVNPNMDLYLFVADVCSALHGQFIGESSISDLQVFRFTGDPNNFADPRLYSENRCYCDEEEVENCLRGGLRDLEPCYNAPMIASFPHLYLADKEYQSYVTGLHPNKTLHETYVDVDPLTGYPLRGAKRIQMNMFLEQINGIDILANVSNGLLPLIWIEEGLAINEEIVKKIAQGHRRIFIMKSATVIFIILCIIVAIVALLLYLYMEKLFCFKNLASNQVVALFQMSWQKDKTDGISKVTLSTVPDSVCGRSPCGKNKGCYPHQLAHRSNNVF